MAQVIIIGGGIAGLATAALLAHSGDEVLLLERGDQLGGRAGSIEDRGFRFETGPSWFLMREVFDHFFELLSTSTDAELDLRLLDPGYTVFTEPGDRGDPPITVPHGIDAVAEVFEAHEPGGGAAVRKYVKTAVRTAEVARSRFLYNPFTRLASVFGADVVSALPTLARLVSTSLERYVNKRFTHPVLRKILAYPAVFLGTDPKRAPAIYHLLSAFDLSQGVFYPMGGFRALVEQLEQLARRSGVSIVTSAEVDEVMVQAAAGRMSVSGVRWSDSAGSAHIELADVVVSAADLHHTETQLLPARARSYPESWWTKADSGPGAIIAMLGVDGPVPELGHHSLFFADDWDANMRSVFGSDSGVPEPASLYVCKPSASDPAVAPVGKENIFVLIPVPPDVEIGAGGSDGGGSPLVESAVDRAIDRISEWSGVDDLRGRISVRRTLGPADFANDFHAWKGGMLGPSHTLRQSAFLRAQNKSRRVDGLYYAGATTAPGIGVPMCLISAELVAKRIRNDHSAGPSPV